MEWAATLLEGGNKVLGATVSLAVKNMVAGKLAQIPGRIQKVDPLMGVPIKYLNPKPFLDPPGGLGSCSKQDPGAKSI